MTYLVKRLIVYMVLLFACINIHAASDAFTINSDGEQVRFAEANLSVDAVLPNTADFHLFGWSGKSRYAVTDFYGVSFVRANGAYAGDFLDWGNLQTDGEWRTLTAEEWIYVLTGRDKAADLCEETEKDGQKGLAIWPDSAKTKDINTAVFLPYQGYRDGVDIVSENEVGYYWTATSNDSKQATYINININQKTGVSTNRYLGCSVRLVQSVCQVPVQISVNDETMGTVIFKPQ